MLILVVFVVLAIIFTCIIVKDTKDSTSSTTPLLWCIPLQVLGALFLFISVAAPSQYKEIKLEAEHELASFNVNGSYNIYAILDEGTYICYLNDGTNKPMSYPIGKVTSVIYIAEEEMPKICEYVQECKWTWYAAPLREDKVNYVLHIPEGSIFYGSTK